MSDHCVICDRSLARRQRHVLSMALLESRREFVEHIFSTMLHQQEISFDSSRSICHPCWQRIDYAIRRTQPSEAQQNPQAGQSINEAQPNPQARQSINVDGLSRAPNSSRRCLFENCNALQLRQVPNSLKTYLLSYYNLYIPVLSRICQNHLRNTSWADFATNVTRRQNDFKAEHILDIIRIYTQALEQKAKLDFENLNGIDEDTLHFWTGINHAKFYAILEETPSLSERSKTPRTDLGVYLSKIRTGEPGSRLASVFSMSRQNLELKINRVWECLAQDYVPLHLGFDHISREEIIRRNRALPNHIFGTNGKDKAIVICDGTYVRIVCGDGYIIEVTGPYAATTSDATIMKNILNNHTGLPEDAPILWLLEEGDVFVLDRGFRDSIPELESCGFEAHIPPTKSCTESQLSTENANKSRRITIVRWVIEAINGRFKRDFKILRNTYFNKSAHNAMIDFKIAALINDTQESFDDSIYTDDFIEMINRNMNRPNLLAVYVDEYGLNRQRVAFERLEDNLLRDFPLLTNNDIIIFSVGTYHLKLARSYCYEHIRGNGIYEIEVHRNSNEILTEGEEENTLLRGRINLRHVRSWTYYTYIMYSARQIGRNAITQYHCSCIHGRRTLGSCAHVISILYYLGVARHEGWQQPAGFLDSVLMDAKNI